MEYKDILEKMRKVHEKKNHDYAKDENTFSNFTFAADLASNFNDNMDKTFVTLIGIKLARLIALQNKEAVNESVDDTYQDLTIYCSLWWMYNSVRNEQWNEDQLRLDYRVGK